MTEREDWLEVAEKGSVAGMWAVVVLATLLGRRPTRAFLRLVALYYATAHPGVRRASRQYFERLGGGPVSWRTTYGHCLRFTHSVFDRLYFVRGKTERFEVVSVGEEHLWRLVEQGRGAILLGSHLGSFEAMQRMADARQIRISIVGYFRNAPMINELLRRLNPESRARLIEVDPDSVDFVFEIKERIEAGELVAVLGDRVIGARGRSASVEFLGAPARFPTGAFALAAAVKCPIFLVFGVQRGGSSRYELYCEPFADEVCLPRQGREEALAALAQRYAARLERYCRLAPDNWFNFFDFWVEPEEPAAAVEGAAQ